MIKTLEKLGPFFAIVLLIAILVSLFLWPNITQPIVWILIILITGMAIIFAVQNRIRAYRQKEIDRSGLVRNIEVDIARILITIILAGLLAWKMGDYLGRKVDGSVEAIRPGWGPAAGMLAGLLLGVVVGLGVAGFVQWIFDLLTRLSLGEPIHSTPEINRR